MHSRLLKGILVGACVVIGIWWFKRRDAGEVRVVDLPDGSRCVVRQVTYGKSHAPADASLWQRLLCSMSTNLAGPLGLTTRNYTTPGDTLVMWIEWQGPTNIPRHPHWIRVVDSNGLASRFESEKRFIARSNHTALSRFDITSFPPRERYLSIELSGQHPDVPNGLQRIGNLRIRRPRVDRKLGIPTLPTSAEVHGQQFELLGINTGLTTTGIFAAMHLSNDFTEFIFRIGTNEPAQRSTNAQEAGEWSIRSLAAYDSFGNIVSDNNPLGRVFAMGQQITSRKDDGIALISGSIWPGEIWNVRAEFNHFSTRLSDPAHRWDATVRIPAAGEKFMLQQTGVVEGCVIELKSIEGLTNSPPVISCRFHERDSKYLVRVLNAEDQRGSNVVVRFRGETKPVRRYELRVGPDSRKVRLSFGSAHPVVVQLSGMVNLLRTNVAHWSKD